MYVLRSKVLQLQIGIERENSGYQNVESNALHVTTENQDTPTTMVGYVPKTNLRSSTPSPSPSDVKHIFPCGSHAKKPREQNCRHECPFHIASENIRSGGLRRGWCGRCCGGRCSTGPATATATAAAAARNCCADWQDQAAFHAGRRGAGTGVGCSGFVGGKCVATRAPVKR